MFPWSGGWDSNPLTYKDRIYSPAPLSHSTASRSTNALSKHMSNLIFDDLPVYTCPGWNVNRLDTSRRIVKTFAVQAPQTGGSTRHARTSAIALFYWWSKNKILADIAYLLGARQIKLAPGGKPWTQTRKPLRRRIYSNQEKRLRIRSLNNTYSWKRVSPSGAFINSASFPYNAGECNLTNDAGLRRTNQ